MLPSALSLLGLAVFGLVIGSFLNVVIHRVPLGISLLSPGSACPVCEHPVRSYDNVPVVSWLVLRGRCRDCDARISWRYPTVELVTGGLFLLAGVRFGWSPYLLAALLLVAAGVAMFLIDLEHGRLPFSVTGVTAVLTALVLGVDAALDGTDPALVALLSALGWLAVYGGVWLVTGGRGMGLGDVALSPVLGLALGWLGWGPSVTGLLSGFLLGAAVGLVLLGTGRATRRSRVPHGPFMLAGGAVGMFAGQQLWEGYLRLVGLG